MNVYVSLLFFVLFFLIHIIVLSSYFLFVSKRSRRQSMNLLGLAFSPLGTPDMPLRHVSSAFHHPVICLTSPCHLLVITLSSDRHHPVISLSAPCYLLVITLSSACQHPVICVSSLCHLLVITMSSACHNPVISMSSPCALLVITMFSSGYQLICKLICIKFSLRVFHHVNHSHRP